MSSTSLMAMHTQSKELHTLIFLPMVASRVSIRLMPSKSSR